MKVDIFKDKKLSDLCCLNCGFWCGRCTKGRINRIGWSESCEAFQARTQPSNIDFFLSLHVQPYRKGGSSLENGLEKLKEVIT
jgi:hypothetical protein